MPTGTAARPTYAATVGADGGDRLGALETPAAPAWRCAIPAMQRLQRVWAQQYQPREAGGHWRQAAELPPAGQVQNSPDDPAARDGKQRQTTWVGDKGHLTETGAPDTPHLLIQVTTPPAATADETILPAIQGTLAQHELLPSTQLVAAGDIDAEALATRRTRCGVDLLGPPRGA